MIGHYALKKPLWRFIASVIDCVGYAFRQPAGSASINPRRILVVRLDQLGDIVQTLPFFDGLKASFPDAQIDFWTTPAGAELFKNARPGVHPVSESALPVGYYDCIFELRGDIRLIAKLKLLRPKALIGYGATGGGFMLDVEIPWERGLHAVDKSLRLLEAVGGKATGVTPRIPVKPSIQPARRISIAVHPDAGTLAKKWPVENFARVIERLAAELDAWVVLVGLNKQMGEDIVSRLSLPVDNRMGKTSLAELIALLAECDALLTNDSGPAHLMAALGKPVWIVWSGTADRKIWAPRGSLVTLIDHPVACAPCSRPVCNVEGHPCLAKIDAETVTGSLLSYFRPSFSGVSS